MSVDLGALARWAVSRRRGFSIIPDSVRILVKMARACADLRKPTFVEQLAYVAFVIFDAKRAEGAAKPSMSP